MENTVNDLWHDLMDLAVVLGLIEIAVGQADNDALEERWGERIEILRGNVQRAREETIEFGSAYDLM